MKFSVKKIVKIIATLPVILVVALALLLQGFQLFGLEPYSVLSGSMESVYPTGSLIYITKTNPAELAVNDVITFRMANGAIATHRIVELVPDETDTSVSRFRTKGDENEIADGTLVDFNSVVGKPVFCIPFLGYLATYISQPPGKYVALAVASALFLLEALIGVLLDDKGEGKNQKRHIGEVDL